MSIVPDWLKPSSRAEKLSEAKESLDELVYGLTGIFTTPYRKEVDKTQNNDDAYSDAINMLGTVAKSYDEDFRQILQTVTDELEKLETTVGRRSSDSKALRVAVTNACAKLRERIREITEDDDLFHQDAVRTASEVLHAKELIKSWASRMYNITHTWRSHLS